MTVNASRIISPPMVAPEDDWLSVFKTYLVLNVDKDQQAATVYAFDLALAATARCIAESGW